MKVRFITQEEFLTFFSLPDVTGNLFAYPEWWAVYGSRAIFIAIGNDRIEEAWVVFRGGRWGFYSLITPPLAPCIGYVQHSNSSFPLFFYRDACFNLAKSEGFRMIKFDFPPDLTVAEHALQPASSVLKYTYHLSLPDNPQTLLEHFSSKKRNTIRTAKKRGEICELVSDPQIVAEMISRSFVRKGVRSGRKFLRPLITSLSEGGRTFMVRVLEGNQELWYGVFAIDGPSCYYLLGAIAEDGGTSKSANSVGIFFAMEEAIRRECSLFDFEGSMIPDIETFIKGYKGKKVHYLSISWSDPQWRLIKFLTGKG